jgi:hypothetical protein
VADRENKGAQRLRTPDQDKREDAAFELPVFDVARRLRARAPRKLAKIWGR